MAVGDAPSGPDPCRGTRVGSLPDTVDDVEAFIRGVPKAELHLHLEGTLEPGLKLRLAERNGLRLPYASEEEVRAAYAFDDLPSFLAVYYEGMDVLRTEEDFADLTRAYLERARSQNVVYAEVFFDPQAHTSRGMPFEAVVSGIRRAQVEAEESLGLRSRLIMCFLRDLPAESAMETLEASLPFRDLIAGVGLDSDEKGNPPSKFDRVFRRARDEGYRITIHCDVDQEDAVEHIRQALSYVDTRIDHGVNSLEDEGLVEEIRRRGLGLTVCPISNGYVAGGLKAEEIKRMLDLGLRVTVNSDDPAYFPGYVTENLLAVHRQVGLTPQEVLRLQRNALEVAWLAPEEREGYLGVLETWAASAGGSTPAASQPE